MSGVVGIFSRDGSPVDPAIAQRMLERLHHRGPDGADFSLLSLAGLGHQHFWTTPEETGERQPLTDPTGRYALVFDGRLDNRDELIAALPGAQADDSDASLTLLGYAHWGEDCFARLLGPFVVVLIDTVQRRVVCARDALGDRTLFYHINARLCLVASEEQVLLAHPALTIRLNESRLAAYFALHVPGDGSTFFADVSELLPAHVLVIDDKAVQLRRYWEPSADVAIRYQSDADYAEHFRALLAESVACRIRASSAPVMMMSGGLDSTSVAALAAQQWSKTSFPARLRALSYVFDELSSCDERAFLTTMYAQHAIDAVHLIGDDAWPLRDISAWPTNPNTPANNPYRWLKERVYTAAQHSASRVVLTGIFGDELYSGAEYWLRDLLVEPRLAQAWNESIRHVRAYGLWHWLRQPVRYCLPGMSRLQRWRWRQFHPWLTSAAHAELHTRDQWSERVRAASRPSQFDTLLGPYSAMDATAEIFHASRCGVELRHPYRDRRLVEFMLAIPASQLYRQGRYKPILRTAMQGILPEPIRLRSEPTVLTPLFIRGLADKERTTVKDLLYGPNRLWPRYVRAEWLAQARPGQRRSEAEELVLWLCLCCELWRPGLT